MSFILLFWISKTSHVFKLVINNIFNHLKQVTKWDFSTNKKMMGTLHLYIMWIRLYMYVHIPQSYNCWIRCLAFVRTYADESQRATLELPLWEKAKGAKGVGIVLLGDFSLFYFRSLNLFWVLFSRGLFSESCLFDFFLSFLWVFYFRDWVKKDDRLVNQLLLGFLCGWAAFCFRLFFLLNLFGCLSVFFFPGLEECARFLFFPFQGSLLCDHWKGVERWELLLKLLLVAVGGVRDLGAGRRFGYFIFFSSGILWPSHSWSAGVPVVSSDAEEEFQWCFLALLFHVSSCWWDAAPAVLPSLMFSL